MLVTPAFAGLIHEECYEFELHTEFQASLSYRDPVSKQSKQTPNPMKTNKPKNCVCAAGREVGAGMTLRNFSISKHFRVWVFRLEKVAREQRYAKKKKKVKSEKL